MVCNPYIAFDRRCNIKVCFHKHQSGFPYDSVWLSDTKTYLANGTKNSWQAYHWLMYHSYQIVACFRVYHGGELIKWKILSRRGYAFYAEFEDLLRHSK